MSYIGQYLINNSKDRYKENRADPSKLLSKSLYFSLIKFYTSVDQGNYLLKLYFIEPKLANDNRGIGHNLIIQLKYINIQDKIKKDKLNDN